MKSVKWIFAFLGTVFMVLGIVLLGVAGWQRESGRQWMENGVRADGVYVSVGKGNTRVQYEAEGRVWEARSSVYSSDMHVGEAVDVWYPQGRPEQGRITVWATWGVFLIVGGVFFLIGAGFMTVVLAKIMRRRSLEMNGTHVTAEVTHVAQNFAVRINGRHPYVIHAVCTHPYTGQEMKVKSEFLLDDPQIPAGSRVDVLVDPMRERRYCMLPDGGGSGTNA